MLTKLRIAEGTGIGGSVTLQALTIYKIHCNRVHTRRGNVREI